ncbi:helix-turn-helix domain-containing protein [Leucobacter sp. HY1908]
MLIQQLHAAREAHGDTVSQLAKRAGTSRSTLSNYERHVKIPRVDTAERIAEALGLELIALKTGPKQAYLDRGLVARLDALHLSPGVAVRTATRELAMLVDADVNAERLSLSWGAVKTRVEGTTVGSDDDDPLELYRLGEIVQSAQTAIQQSSNQGTLPTLAANGRVISPYEHLEPAHQALDLLVRAVSAGADPTLARHLINSYLLHKGFPWLYVRHSLVSEYRQAVVSCLRTGNGDRMVDVLLVGAEMFMSRATV